MTAEVKRIGACAVLFTGGLASGFGIYVGAFFLLAPVLLFATFLYAHYVALAIAVVAAMAVFLLPRHCRAPVWCQRDKAWFWLGAIGFLLYVCASM